MVKLYYKSVIITEDILISGDAKPFKMGRYVLTISQLVTGGKSDLGNQVEAQSGCLYIHSGQICVNVCLF